MLGITSQLKGLAVGFSALAIPFIKKAIEEFIAGETRWAALSVVAALLLALLVAICLDIVRRRPADSWGYLGLLEAYCVHVLLRGVLSLGFRHIRAQLADCRTIQERLLGDILKQNAQTEYGETHQLAGISSREEFVKQHPLTEYSNYQEYVYRMAGGEENLLTKERAAFFALTSGTTGKNKMYPITETTKSNIHLHLLPSMYIATSRIKTLGRTFEFRLYSRARHSENGTQIGSLSQFTLPEPRHSIIPACRSRIYQEKPSYYIQAVFALSEPNITSIQAFSSNLMYSFLKFVENHWSEICDDIDQGFISRFTDDIPKDVLQKLNRHLQPNPARAAELLLQRPRGIVGLVRRVWPDLAFCTLGRSGGFAHCAKVLQDTYLNGVQLVSFGHIASEGFFGAMLEDDWENDTYTFLPGLNFLEFIPAVDLEAEKPRTFFLDELEVDKLYEVVVTNMDGLYRIRTGDVVRVVGFNGDTPKYEIQFRRGQVLNIAYERTPEQLFYEAVQRSEQDWTGIQLLDYTTTESPIIENITGDRSENSCYIFFAEFGCQDTDVILADAQKSKLDEHLCAVHEPYKEFRLKGSIAPITIIQVKLGTFDLLRGYLMSSSGQSIQFKMPRVIRREVYLELLLSRTLRAQTA